MKRRHAKWQSKKTSILIMWVMYLSYLSLPGIWRNYSEHTSRIWGYCFLDIKSRVTKECTARDHQATWHSLQCQLICKIPKGPCPHSVHWWICNRLERDIFQVPFESIVLRKSLGAEDLSPRGLRVVKEACTILHLGFRLFSKIGQLTGELLVCLC